MIDDLLYGILVLSSDWEVLIAQAIYASLA